MLPNPSSDKLRSSLTSFMAETIRPSVENDKADWNAKIRRNSLYYRGLQNTAYAIVGNGLVDYQNVGNGQPLQMRADDNNQTLYDYILNVLQGDVDTFVNVIGNRSPNGQAQARDLNNDFCVRMKRKADRVNAWLESHWKVPELHSHLVRGLALYGTMFSYTRYVANKQRYGVTDVPQYSMQETPTGPAYYQCRICGQETIAEQALAIAMQHPGIAPPGVAVCPRCATPMGQELLIQPDTILGMVQNGSVPYENGAVEVSILNGAYVTAPNNLPKLDQKSPWIIYETEDDKGELIRAYPELRARAYEETYAVDAGDSAAAGRWTREVITSLSGYQIPKSKSRWLHTRMWIAPCTYEYLPNDRTGELREYMLGTYPEGLMVPMVNGRPLVGDVATNVPNRIKGERLTSVWAACKPKPSDSLYCDPYFEVMIQMQDTVNDGLNMLVEQAERSNPFTVADPEVLDPDLMRKYANVPGGFVFAKPGSAGALDKGFFRVQVATLNTVMIDFINQYIAWCREITGIVPAIFGGSVDGTQKTAHEVEVQREQAMMKLAGPWNNTRQFWSDTRMNGIYQAAKYSGGKMFTADSRGTVESQDIDGIWELMNGGWYMESEESMPRSIGQRKDFVMKVLGMGEEAVQLFGLDDPECKVKIQEAVGMSDWVVPGYDQVMRLKDIMGKLSREQPVQQPPPMDMVGNVVGPPPPPQPSISFNSDLFDATAATKTIRGYLNSDTGSDMQDSNPAGYENIMAYLKAAQAAMGPGGPQPTPPKLVLSSDIASLTPPAQQAVFEMQGIHVPPNTLIAEPKPLPHQSHIAAPRENIQ